MAGVLRITFSKFLNSKNVQSFMLPNSVNELIIRGIISKAAKIPAKAKKPAPWPYEHKKFTLFHYFFDKTSSRIDENSKIIVVEGPLAAGKSKFASQLACELDMLYLPEANLDMLYINPYGFDLKTLDPQLPESCRSFDVSDWLKNPKHYKAATFQLNQHGIKFSQYIDALAHVLSTGQGVVLDRCVYSDFVFAEAMYSQKFISKEVKNKYYQFRRNSIDELLRPHLVIYLDVPVEKTLENIKKRNFSMEVNSPAINKDYLTTMETFYKQHYLKQISKHAHLLVYDWSEGGDPEVVIEDIERIDFEKEENDAKENDWDFRMEDEWGVARHKYSDGKFKLMNYLNIPCVDIKELMIDGDDLYHYCKVLEEAPGMKFDEGFNAAMGDKGILFKTSTKPRETLPRVERRFP
ncbi:NADH dehydrogenase [ubiquinone] 1 alpha subcomplex subunit 10, mitochondrial [Agrilus planipennis]|uniref:NADH dehydrogenase [ubiquinone] 1 alpha subcomplex subunit 10, mitochondrial n=1 Tax=Agrilus planipennis TaxID=224129 RepID=A0A1W4XC65_AGRPL|nr:NADH dehydrogenase [ubiquinone] 1 alpha subcomplex subunit 10, mitochondrial [Agrilus planipennis]